MDIGKNEMLKLFSDSELSRELKRRNAERRKERENIPRCRNCKFYGTIGYWGQPPTNGMTNCCPNMKVKSGNHYRVLPQYQKACDKYEPLKIEQ